MKKPTIIIPIVLSITLLLFLLYIKPVSLPFVNQPEFHFSIVTINSIFAGFLYTNYTLLLGLLDNDIVKKLLSTSVIKKRNDHIFTGIVYTVTSIIFGLILAVIASLSGDISQDNDISGHWLLLVFCIIELIFMLCGILYFVMSIREMHLLVRTVGKPKSKVKSDVIKDVKSIIKKEED